MQPLVDRHGAALGQALARVYDAKWPSDPIPVDLTVTAGASGAYGTSEPAHITVTPSTFRGNTALEMLFHESTHTIVPLFQYVSQAAKQQNVNVPPQLSHAVLFYTAGELTVRELKVRGIDYTAVRGRQVSRGHVRRRLPRQDGRALGSASRRQALDGGCPLRTRRRIQMTQLVSSPADRLQSLDDVDSQFLQIVERRVVELRQSGRVCYVTVGNKDHHPLPRACEQDTIGVA